jgi:hypothetical protein
MNKNIDFCIILLFFCLILGSIVYPFFGGGINCSGISGDELSICLSDKIVLYIVTFLLALTTMVLIGIYQLKYEKNNGDK